ncbi:pilus assembly protein PilP [Agaribacterium haliotis]|uniref:pilus assembly protein PilP n=1 Tax=Agaribacterium haliotis TaxID=2013869 RepID=UPI000BB558A9|nr:pilus assembly protein PilP [Agaribacterium haliotis]
MMKVYLFLPVLLLLVSCGSSGGHSDLREYIAQVKARPAGRIEPIPTYPPYESFIYASASKRSPFDKPVDIQRRVYAKANKNVSPDFNRTKEYLEGFDIAGMAMVGTLQQKQQLWALVKDGGGGIHRVSAGNYLGKNHGKVVSVDKTKIELIEIVSDGLDGWVERPRVLALAEKD